MRLGIVLGIALMCILAIQISCKEQSSKAESPYLNHSDSAKYVGINTCKQCHQDIYNTFIETGMGKSFDLASQSKSSANFHQNKPIYDAYLKLYYFPYFKDNQLFIDEYRLLNGDTTHKRTEQVDYIIGSGQHTNSHLMNRNGYVFQMPMTFYTQQGKWDFPPGFENGRNSRFSRRIELECMSCHNAYPNFEEQSQNKFNEVLKGIDCERCHGPGNIHVQEKQLGNLIDTSSLIDYTIVNPKKLPYSLQVDICQRCHLQGNAVLEEGKSFFDFKPGQKLSNTLSVFMPQYNTDEQFIMASHAERMKISQCFIQSVEKGIQLQTKTYSNQILKDEQSVTPLSCISCHNPHKSVKITEAKQLNKPCLSCHYSPEIALKNCTKEEISQTDNCVQCHMPKSGAIDIPHVSITDHKIQVPVSKKQAEGIRTFVALKSVNNPNPSHLIKAKAYLNQFEKFESNPLLLDSAAYFIEKVEDNKSKAMLQIQLHFMKEAYASIINIAQTTAFSFDDPWTNYRIAESYSKSNQLEKALSYVNLSLKNHIYYLDFQFKKAVILQELKRTAEAKNVYQFILKENPYMELAHYNLGYIYLEENNIEGAKKEFLRTYQLNPNYIDAAFGLAGIEAMQQNKAAAKKYLLEILALNPENNRARTLLQTL